MAVSIEILWQGRAELGEGPVWDAATDRLFWTDIIGRRLYRMDGLGGPVTSWDMPEPVGSFAVTDAGDLLAAIGTGFARIDAATGTVTRVDLGAAAAPGMLMNDGKPDRAGGFVCGAKDLAEATALAPAFRVADGKATIWGPPFIVFNGPAFSPTGDRIYLADSPTQRIRTAPYDASGGGVVGTLQVFAALGPDAGYPDGMTVDADGCLWNAHWDGGRLTRYRPDGTVDRVLRVPMRRPTSAAFAGSDLDTLVVTSAAKDQPAGDAHAGALIAITGLGVGGIAETPVRMKGEA
jgi:sugar lactone lactonase YvrE